MRAVGYKRSLPIDQAESLIDIEVVKPAPQGRDLLVQVKAISVNPVDYKVRKRVDPQGAEPKILGYDATGVVAAGIEVPSRWQDTSLLHPGPLKSRRMRCIRQFFSGGHYAMVRRCNSRGRFFRSFRRRWR